MMFKSISQKTLISVLLIYWAIGLSHITIVPTVYEDEPWQASTGLKLVTQGVFGSDVFTGFYHMQDHYYGYLPLHPILLAIIFRFAGEGLYQDRFEPVALGLLLLALTYSLARRLFKDDRIALLSAVFLLAIRTSGLTPSQVSGILLIDFARIARYDMLAAVLGLAALHVYRSAQLRDSVLWYVLVGVLAAASSLAHLYGVFWLIILLMLAVWDRSNGLSRRTIIGSILIGFMLAWLPYILYVLGDMADWRGQAFGYADRFDLFNLNWYLQNVLEEYKRYGPGLGPIGSAWFTRIGFWSTLIGLPVSIGVLLRRSLRAPSLRIVAVPTVVLPIFFALFIRLKLANYLVTLIPVWSMAAGWGAVRCWDWLSAHKRWSVQLVAVVLLGAALLEGATRIAVLESAGLTLSPYYTFIDRVRTYIPIGSRILGFHNYWFGLEAFDYRSMAVPLWQADPLSVPFPQSFETGLQQIDPDIVLLDPRLRQAFETDANQGGNIQIGFTHWLNQHQGQLLGSVDDPTYGRMDIYQVQR